MKNKKTIKKSTNTLLSDLKANKDLLEAKNNTKEAPPASHTANFQVTLNVTVNVPSSNKTGKA